MGETSIQWCDFTFNPWQGCQRVSPGCVNCYAEARDQRFNRGKNWGPGGVRTRTSPANWRKPLAWNAKAQREGKRYRVFCASLADVFEDRPELIGWRFELFDLIRKTPYLDWLLLTKRPENIARLWPLYAMKPGNVGLLSEVVDCPKPGTEAWPNIWLGTTVEDQQRANERIPELLKVPAAVRFLSMEPLLESVFFGNNVWNGDIQWIIIGGESGPKARPFHIEWARSLVQQARDVGAAPFVKQMGSNPRQYIQKPWAEIEGDDDAEAVKLKDHHGGDMNEWPEDLRVREFPDRCPEHGRPGCSWAHVCEGCGRRHADIQFTEAVKP